MDTDPIFKKQQLTTTYLDTTAYLGRIARTSDQLSDEENNKEVERAIDEIIRYDFQNIYRKITSKSETNEHKEKAS